MNRKIPAATGIFALLSASAIAGSASAVAQENVSDATSVAPHVVQGEAEEYVNNRGKDVVVYELLPPQPVPYSSLPGASNWNQLNSKEKAQCKSHPAQCVAYYGISKAALNFQNSQKGLINKGKSSKDRDDRGQAVRHQYWFAMMNAEWGQVPAWQWAMAHEGDEYMKTKDSRCDMDNNAKGNIIGVQAGQMLHSGQSAGAVKQWIAGQVVNNINKGNYCRR